VQFYQFVIFISQVAAPKIDTENCKLWYCDTTWIWYERRV